MTLPIPQDFTYPVHMALFLDFDGTLAGFKDDPDAVHLSLDQKTLLMALSDKLDGALALISGRDLRDLSKRVPQTLWRLGNHGLFKAGPNEPAPETFAEFPTDLLSLIDASLSEITGTRIERKGPVIAIHHRANPAAGKLIFEAISAHLPHSGKYLVQTGHCVVELKPRGANKGKALTAQMQHAAFQGRTPVMIGDDTTDEDGFIACTKLGGFGIKMGDGPTEAAYRIGDIPTLYTYLERLL
jgi:trehalose 6-phosphate phosphatase